MNAKWLFLSMPLNAARRVWQLGPAALVLMGISGCATLPPEQQARQESGKEALVRAADVESAAEVMPEAVPEASSTFIRDANIQIQSSAQPAFAAPVAGTSPMGSPLELQQLLYSTWQKHPKVAAAQAEVRAARAEISQAGALMDPELSLTQGLDDTSRTGVSVAQRLPLFGQRGLAAERAEYQAQAAEAAWRNTQAEVARDLLSNYAEHAYILETRAIVQQQHLLLRQMLDVARIRYSAGATGQGDLLRLENELDQLANQQISLEAMVPVSAVRLNAALGRSSQNPLPETLPLKLLPLDIEPDQLAYYLEQHNPQLQMLKHQQSAGRVGRTLAGKSGRPDLMVGLEYMREPDMGKDQVNIMLGINLPIWRGNYRAQRDQAEANLQMTSDRLLDLQLQLHAELRLALFNLQESLRNHSLYQDRLVPRAEQALHANLTAYRSGGATFADLIASQQEWLGLQLNQKRALADALRWQGELIFLLGVSTLVLTEEVLQ